MFHEYSFAGFYFSPVTLFAVMALTGTIATIKLLSVIHLRQKVWAGSWFDLSIFLIYMAASAFFIRS
ncbi:DUF1656 domain-containing protein [Pantoea anthophila]|uniref:DUF1656 domain-containing protein n=1 Tax=Pantoea anthophila TaxID=470931 RepID=A0ABY2Z4P7_9GAMM|nr:DUF1656 domain-containing protein [Pantoea anthophila]TPV23629.1 DUF1656 domain-containing protein [Pantoea anthophila]